VGLIDREPRPVVIGAGVGGLCAAALLAHRGRRPIVIERSDRIGGRASTELVDGFLINVGAVGLELGGEMQALFEEVGAPYVVPEPAQPIVVRARGRTFNASHPIWRWLIDGVLLRCGGVLARRRWPADQRDAPGDESFDEWLARRTRNATIHRVMRNVSAGLLSVNTHELTARAMITYFTQKGGFRRFGYLPGGTISAWRALQGAIERDGGEVWLGSDVTRVRVSDDGAVTGVVVQRAGETVELETAAVISNAGPRATIALCGAELFPSSYLERVERDQRSAAMITFHLASREPLMGRAGLVFFADTERLCALAYLTSSAPDLTPPGWHLYVAGAVPDPAVGPFDADAEVARAWAELVREVPRAAQARLITTRVMRDEWPCQRAVIGRDLPQQTPIAGLWNVGDAARAYPNAGTQGCAESARLAVDALLASAESAPSTRSRSRPPARGRTGRSPSPAAGISGSSR
jgi:phytoene dehydrogenase-like protein